jgi:glycosyltransferase involved in cell wall biosynthesis
MPDPSVSILMTVFNGERYLRETLESVLAQTFSDFELIIIDDGSTDKTSEIIHAFNDPRTVYHHQPNAGTCRASNKGLSLARGKYVARIDADDICLPERIARQFEFLEMNPDHVLCASRVRIMDAEGNYIYTPELPETDEQVRAFMEHSNPFAHSATCFRKEIADRVGGYYEPVKSNFEDFIFLYQLGRHGKIYIFPEPLISYRLLPGSLSFRIRDVRFRKVQQDIVKRGYAKPEELEFLFSIQKSRNLDPDDKTYNYYILLAKLHKIEAGNCRKSMHYLRKAISMKPFAFKYNASAVLQIFAPVKIIRYIRKHYF